MSVRPGGPGLHFAHCVVGLVLVIQCAFAVTSDSPGSWLWGSTWCGTGQHQRRNADNVYAAANDVLALAWTTPPDRWASFHERFAKPSNTQSCTSKQAAADLACSIHIVLELLNSRAQGEAALVASARQWGDVGAYLAVAMHLAQPHAVDRMLASFDLKTRTLVEKAIAPIRWIGTALASDNPFVELSRLAALDFERELLLDGGKLRQRDLRANPFVGVGWTIRWRAEDKLVAAYRTELGLLTHGKKTECLTLFALHQISTPSPPKKIASVANAYRKFPACSKLARMFRFRNGLREGMPSFYGNMFASPIVLLSLRDAMRANGAAGRTLKAPTSVSTGSIPADHERTLNEDRQTQSEAAPVLPPGTP